MRLTNVEPWVQRERLPTSSLFCLWLTVIHPGGTWLEQQVGCDIAQSFILPLLDGAKVALAAGETVHPRRRCSRPRCTGGDSNFELVAGRI